MITMLTGDCRAVLPTLPDASVHCVVTSPPYWGLRDYGTAKWEGGDPACEHISGPARNDITPERLAERAAQYGAGTGNGSKVSPIQFPEQCGLCGARRIDSQIGLETSLGEYIDTMVAVFREVRRVLRDDGTLWLNLGDSYAAGGGGFSIQTAPVLSYQANTRRAPTSGGLKPKDLCGIPWRVAFALHADGWYLRQDIIWSKPNPMPESVTDRCTKAHEYLFLLSKRERYYYDASAIAEDVKPGNEEKIIRYDGTQKNCETIGDPRFATRITSDRVVGSKRNKRSVWEVTTQPFSEAHFATFPPALIEPCIKAGTSEKGCCSKCGKPWVRQTEYGQVLSTGGSDKGMRANNMASYDPSGQHTVASAYNTGNMVQREKLTTGWSPSCACAADPVPCTVLDPFGGAGTTGLVADRLQRNAILIELNPAYAAMGERRIVGDAPLFVQFAPQQAPPAPLESWAEMWAKPFDFSKEPKGNPR